MKLERYSTEEEKLEAVRESADNIQYIKNPSKEMQLQAVKQDGRVLRWIKTNDDEVILTALETANEDSIWEFLVNNDYKTLSDEVKLAIQLK